MTTLKVGIADYREMKARTLRIARGEEHPGPDGSSAADRAEWHLFL